MKYILLLASCSVLFFSFSTLSNEIGPVKNFFKIDQIEVQGLKRIEKVAVLEKIQAKPGSVLTNYGLKQDIERLYEMKFFENIEAHHEIKNGKQTLVLKMEEKPVIELITFKGNSEISRDDILEKIQTKKYNILDIGTLKKDLLEIEKLYEDKGYYLAKADYQLEPTKQGNSELIFHITENNKVKVKKITYLGNKAFSDEELKSFPFLQVKEGSFFSFLSGSGSYKEFDFKLDLERLKYFYKTKGYLQVNFGKPVVTISDDKRWVFITVKVNEGPQYRVNKIFFSGDLLYEEDKLREAIGHAPESIFNEELIQKDIEKLTEMYQDLGHAFVNVSRNLSVVEGEDKVDVDFQFEKGPIAKFGKVTIAGNDKTRDKVILRELRFQEGEKFSGSKLRLSKENVNRLGFFERGTVVFKQNVSKSQPDVVDIEVGIKERQTGQISLGAGYSSASKGFIQGQVTYDNFRGLGQSLNASVQWSSQQQTFSLGFTDPYFMDTLWTFGGDLYRTQSSFISSFEFRKFGGSIRVGHPLSDYTRLFLTYRLEDTKIKDLDDPTYLLSSTDTIDDVNEREGGMTSSLRSAIVYDKRNNSFEPTEGLFVSTSLEYAGLGFDQKWTKAEFEGRFYQPVYKDLIFRTRLLASEIWKVGSQNVPRVEKFTMGGSRNLRGYNIEDVGPTFDATGLLSPQNVRRFNRGGTKRLLTQLELEYPLVKDAGLKGVLFYDVGNVYEDNWLKDSRGHSFRQDFGFGIRWFSPIGILRFELGFPIDRREGEDANQFHFDLGQLF